MTFHAGFIVARNITAEFERGALVEHPDDFTLLARFNQCAVPVIVFHSAIHLVHHQMAGIHHLLHFGLM